MPVSEQDRRLLQAIEDGLPLVPRPYQAIGTAIGLSEEAVIDRLRALIEAGIINRFGLIVRHRELGYIANAMVVWDVPDEEVAAVGARMASFPFVTLCYRRERRTPLWPYNLYCMIHGKDRAGVEALIAALKAAASAGAFAHAVLFSRRCFKQRGARYWAV